MCTSDHHKSSQNMVIQLVSKWEVEIESKSKSEMSIGDIVADFDRVIAYSFNSSSLPIYYAIVGVAPLSLLRLTVVINKPKSDRTADAD